MRIRYIRDWANGNTNGANSNWNEIGAYDYNNTNIALNKTVTPSKDGNSSVSASVVTDGSDDVAFAFSGLGNVTIDLGGIYDIDRIRIRRYFPNGNSTTQYHETKTEVSIDGQDWITVFDCNVDGKYYETSEGKIIKLRKDIDKLEENSSLKDVKDKIIEIENSLQTTKDYFKDILINKGIECNESDKISSLIDKVSRIISVSEDDSICFAICNNTDSKIYLVDPNTYSVVGTLNTPTGYIGLAKRISSTKGYELLSFTNNNVNAVDLSTETITRVASVSLMASDGHSDNGEFDNGVRSRLCSYGSYAGSILKIYDAETFATIKSGVPSNGGAYGRGVGGGFDGTNERLFISANNRLDEVNPDTYAIIRSNTSTQYASTLTCVNKGDDLKCFILSGSTLAEFDVNTLNVVSTKTLPVSGKICGIVRKSFVFSVEGQTYTIFKK